MEIYPLREAGSLIIFSDFDGTFTARDVGNRIFTHFSQGANKELISDWKAGKITSRECLTGEAELIKIGPDEFYAFIDQFELRPGAAELVTATEQRGIPFIILSDGVDLYIEHILRKHNLGQVPFRSNRGILTGERLEIEFPCDNRGCRRCGCCKGARMTEILERFDRKPRVVFIGDGLSDTCAIPKADLIFARGDLLEFCRSKNITAIEYNDFFDILSRLKESGYLSG